MRIAPFLTIGSILWIFIPLANAADSNRGQALYETRCIECHDVSVHGRTNRVARNYDEVRSWVVRWNKTLGVLWDPEDIEDVSAYLNSRYYRYPWTGSRF